MRASSFGDEKAGVDDNDTGRLRPRAYAITGLSAACVPLALAIYLRYRRRNMSPTKTATPLFAQNLETVRRALRELDGGALLPALGAQLERALDGSGEATREYVRCFHVLTLRVLDEAHRARPDVVVRTAEGHLALIDLKGTPRRAPVEALETASAEAPFGPWTAHFALEEAVALDLTSRVRQLIGLRALDLAPAGPGLGEIVDDLSARRFLRLVRFYLNHPDEEHPLRRLMEAFELSKTELASLFGVRRQAVDQWLERGVPSERQEKVQTLVAICDLLERKLKPGRLAGVARRPADAYGGKTMLELIAAHRHRELLDLVRDSFDWASVA
jgi:DNA-binding XRE family transcriptional regulator